MEMMRHGTSRRRRQRTIFPLMIFQTLYLVGVTAFSTPVSRQFIELTNPLKNHGLQDDRLPASFVKSWPTWVFDTGKRHSINSDQWIRIPDSDGFVPPTSIEELWQPQDLKLPTCQLAVGLHVRNGMIRHILPAVDLSFGDGNHRNRGLCSVPRAYQWMDFGAAMAGGLDVVSMVLQVREGNDNGDNSSHGMGSELQWKTVAEIDSIEKPINMAIEALAQNPPSDLGDGSSVVHILLDKATIKEELLGESTFDCPKPGSEMRVLLEEDGITVGALHVNIEKTAPGSESEYLPDAYRDLYEDESLLRPAFIEARRRLGDRGDDEEE